MKSIMNGYYFFQKPPIPTDEDVSVKFAEPDAKTYTRDGFLPEETAGLIRSGAYNGTSLTYLAYTTIPFRKRSR